MNKHMRTYMILTALALLVAVAGYLFQRQAVEPATAASIATQPAPLSSGQAYIVIEAQDGQKILQTPAPAMIETIPADIAATLAVMP